MRFCLTSRLPLFLVLCWKGAPFLVKVDTSRGAGRFARVAFVVVTTNPSGDSRGKRILPSSYYQKGGSASNIMEARLMG